jgi:hypothetical protein
MSSNQGNPLGDRGKAAEDEWARRQDREAMEKMRKQKPKTKQKGDAASDQTTPGIAKDGKAD